MSGAAVVAELPPRKHFPTGFESIVAVGTFPFPAESACRANKTAGKAKTTKKAKATLTQVFNTVELHHESREREGRRG
jgi:hypothetical protein